MRLGLDHFDLVAKPVGRGARLRIVVRHVHDRGDAAGSRGAGGDADTFAAGLTAGVDLTVHNAGKHDAAGGVQVVPRR